MQQLKQRSRLENYTASSDIVFFLEPQKHSLSSLPCTKTEGGRNGREVLDAGAEAHVPEDGEAAEDLGCEYGSQGTVRCKGV